MITNSALQPDPFFNPQDNYGWENGNFATTPLGDVLGNEQNREGSWGAYLVNQGFGGTGSQNELGRSLWNRANQGYAAVQTKNPLEKWTDYLKTLNLGQIAAGMSAGARGETPNKYVQPLRYAMRAQ